MFSFSIVVIVVFIGAGVVSSNEDLAFYDGFYWACKDIEVLNSQFLIAVTCTTVGYGDIPLTKQSTRIFAAFYILVGCFAVASSVGNFANVFIERQQQRQKEKILKQVWIYIF